MPSTGLQAGRRLPEVLAFRPATWAVALPLSSLPALHLLRVYKLHTASSVGMIERLGHHYLWRGWRG